MGIVQRNTTIKKTALSLGRDWLPNLNQKSFVDQMPPN